MAMHRRDVSRSQNPAGRLIALVLGVCVAFYAHAAMRITPVSTTVTGSTASGVGTRNVIEMVLDGNGTYVQKNVGVSAATLGRLAKGALKRAVPVVGGALALKNLVDGAGWVVDELSKQVQTPGSAQEPLPSGGVWCMYRSAWGPSYTQIRCATTLAAAAYKASPDGLQTLGATAQTGQGTGVGYYYQGGQYQYQIAILYRTPTPTGDVENGNPSSPPVEISDQQLGDLVRQHPGVAQYVLLDENGNPILTPELAEAINNLRKQAEAANGLPPAPDVVADPNAGSTPQDNVQTDLPLFCDYAAKLCEWLDWTRTPHEREQVEVPEEELQLPSGWDSGLGEGSCPAPISTTITTPLTYTIDYTFQPLCDLAGLLKPLLIACAAIVAALIVGGSRRA